MGLADACADWVPRLVMATRCGDVDPAVIMYLMANCGLSIKEVDTLLNKQSGWTN
jgi:acetate kinase